MKRIQPVSTATASISLIKRLFLSFACDAAFKKLRLALAGIACATLVSTFFMPSLGNTQGAAAPTKIFMFVDAAVPCGNWGWKCGMIACLSDCGLLQQDAGLECCEPGVELDPTCLYCGP